jgi:hypothetical protein
MRMNLGNGGIEICAYDRYFRLAVSDRELSQAIVEAPKTLRTPRKKRLNMAGSYSRLGFWPWW